MALTRDKKNELVSQVSELLKTSKITVLGKYQGTTVKQLQSLRKIASSNNTTIKIVKNRLVLKALANNPQFKDINANEFNGMLVYAFNPDDEVAPAQVIAEFIKDNPESINYHGALTADGKWLDKEEVMTLSKLPSKPVLIAGVIGLLKSPIQNVSSSLSQQLPIILSSLSK